MSLRRSHGPGGERAFQKITPSLFQPTPTRSLFLVAVVLGKTFPTAHKMAVPSPLMLIQSVPPVTRAFTAATIASSALYGYLCWKDMGLKASQYMLLVPGTAVYAPWTLLTSAFVETTIFEVSDAALPRNSCFSCLCSSLHL